VNTREHSILVRSLSQVLSINCNTVFTQLRFFICGLWTSEYIRSSLSSLASHHMGGGCKLLVPSHNILHLMNLLELKLILCDVYYGLCRLDPQCSTIFSGVGHKLDIGL